MKLIYSLLFVVAFFVNAKAQLGFDVGAKGQFNSTWLINKNTYNAGDEQDYSPSWGSNYGMVFGLRMGGFCTGLETNFGMHNAEFNGKTLLGDYTSKIALKTFQLPVYLRFQNEGGAYFEIGAQYNKIKSALYSYDGIVDGTSDESSEYAKSYSTAFIGFGVNRKIVKSVPLGIIFGVRLQYGIKDAKGVDALGNSLSNSLLYPDYYKTRAAAAGLNFGLIYTIDTKGKESGY